MSGTEDPVSDIRAGLQAVAEANGIEASSGLEGQSGPSGTIGWGSFRIPHRSRKRSRSKGDKKSKRSRRSSSSSSGSRSKSSSESSSSGSSSDRSVRKRGKSGKGSKAPKVGRGALAKSKDVEFRQKTHEHQYVLCEAVSRQLSKVARYVKHGRTKKAKKGVRKAKELIRDWMEDLLIADAYDWRVVAAMETNSNLQGISKEREKNLKQALKTFGGATRTTRGGAGASGYRGRGGSRLNQREQLHNAMLRKGRCQECGEIGHGTGECRFGQGSRGSGTGGSSRPTANIEVEGGSKAQ